MRYTENNRRFSYHILLALGFVMTGIVAWMYSTNANMENVIPNTSEVSPKIPLHLFSKANTGCYDTSKYGRQYVVDSHLHFQPFNGKALPNKTLMSYLNDTGILFTTAYGIGQTLPEDSPCTYYIDCPGTPVTPNIRNDKINAEQWHAKKSYQPVVSLSMSFPDLRAPDSIEVLRQELEGHYGAGRSTFTWAGEVNAIKLALCPNKHRPMTPAQIPLLKDFMAHLRANNIPLALHSDLGYDNVNVVTGTCEPGGDDNPADNHLQYQDLIKGFLRNYPDNKIVWVHMGLSKQLTALEPENHIEFMKGLLKETKEGPQDLKYQNLYFDLSWRVVAENYFDTSEKRKLYLDFMRANPTRFITGTDAIAVSSLTLEEYRDTVAITSQIFNDLGFSDEDDRELFRRVALGQNYFELTGIADQYRAPQVCVPEQ